MPYALTESSTCLQETLSTGLKQVISDLPTDPMAKAEAALAINRSINETYWSNMGAEVRPLIKQLLDDIPEDFVGKQARAMLINALLHALKLTIIVKGEDGKRHACGVMVYRTRPTDQRGSFRLQERKATVSGRQRGSYSVSDQLDLEIVDLVQEGIDNGYDSPSRGIG